MYFIHKSKESSIIHQNIDTHSVTIIETSYKEITSTWTKISWPQFETGTSGLLYQLFKYELRKCWHVSYMRYYNPLIMRSPRCLFNLNQKYCFGKVSCVLYDQQLLYVFFSLQLCDSSWDGKHLLIAQLRTSHRYSVRLRSSEYASHSISAIL